MSRGDSLRMLPFLLLPLGMIAGIYAPQTWPAVGWGLLLAGLLLGTLAAPLAAALLLPLVRYRADRRGAYRVFLALCLGFLPAGGVGFLYAANALADAGPREVQQAVVLDRWRTGSLYRWGRISVVLPGASRGTSIAVSRAVYLSAASGMVTVTLAPGRLGAPWVAAAE